MPVVKLLLISYTHGFQNELNLHFAILHLVSSNMAETKKKIKEIKLSEPTDDSYIHIYIPLYRLHWVRPKQSANRTLYASCLLQSFSFGHFQLLRTCIQ